MYRQQVMPVRYRMMCRLVLGGHFWAQYIPEGHPVHRDRMVTNTPELLWCATCMAIKEASIPVWGPPTRVEIDRKRRVRGNQTVSDLLLDVHGPQPKVGDIVTVFESESGAQGTGTVTEIDEVNCLIYAHIGWRGLR